MPAEPKYLKGHCLIDSGDLTGSFFARSAVLICQHDGAGAFGLVLNRPMERCIGDIVPTILPEALITAPLFVGGPVQPSALSYLYADPFVSAANVMANLTLGHELDQLIALAEAAVPSAQWRVFAGYAGWSAGQLEDELRRHAWLTFPASVELIFDTPVDQLWPTILRRVGGWKNILHSTMPEDPSLN
jgi:putative transcriptional regulator